MDSKFNFTNFQQYFYQLLYSIYRRKNLVLLVILASTLIVIVTSQLSAASTKGDQDVYNERSQFFAQENRYDQFQDMNLFRKSLDDNGQESNNQNEILRVNNKNDKSQNEESDKNKVKKYVPDYRLVHIDLKGAAPTIKYLKKVIYLIKQAGANGILLEYEDVSLNYNLIIIKDKKCI